ncbi:MAG: sigma-70 family RNA polymerase sigma factor [Gemmataceae bacterium]|nr:sigma-70 family RNA polymerase sigma factor [Gemmataceae bacterium]
MAEDSTRTASEPDVSSESDGDLLVYMSLREDAPAHACAAWAEFYRRHVGYLYPVCRRALSTVSRCPLAPEDLVQDTFRRVYEHAGTFDAGDVRDPDGLRRLVRAWLGAIATNLVRDVLRERETVPPEVLLDPELCSAVAARSDCGPPADLLAIAREVMTTDLSAEEQEVLRITYEWYDPDREHQRLPNDIAADLAGRLRTTTENLRKIRQRALRKFKEGVLRRLGRSPTSR